ncbi:MAG TPA: hypothetical protein VGP76_32420 [Planctomycetaceae bacterium]|jgi:hypothetical protein|nr:hypothetical protein [Planctomycetaceae bacterium]
MPEQLYDSVDLDLDQLIDQHKQLKDLCADPDATERDRQKLLERINQFVARLRRTARQIQTTHDFERVNELALELQSTFSNVLQIPRDVHDEIGLPDSLEQLAPTLRRFAPDEVDAYLAGLAHDISRHRKLSHLSRLVSRLTRQPELIDTWILSTHDETLQDWYNACLFLATEVLSGEIRFVEQLKSDSFMHLQMVWLDDVKELLAYLEWERNGEQGAPYLKHASYYGACQTLHERVLDPELKSPPENFKEIFGWWAEQKYPQRYLFDAGSQRYPQLRPLIERKARRIWDKSLCGDANAHWQSAERFVLQFYGNIISAIRDRDKDAASEVLAAIRCDSEHPVEILNAFEAALVIYGLDAELIASLYRPQESFV